MTPVESTQLQQARESAHGALELFIVRLAGLSSSVPMVTAVTKSTKAITWTS